MVKSKIKINNSVNIKDRPYYVLEDNEKSNIRIKKIDQSVLDKKLELSEETKNNMNNDNFFDTDYLAKVKKDSIKYIS